MPIIQSGQGTVDYPGTETFAKELMLAKLLRKLKSKPMSVTLNLLCFDALLRATCKFVLFR